VILANGNAQDLIRIDTNGAPPVTTVLAGLANTFCDYSLNQCGDGEQATSARFNLLPRSATIPIVGLAVDAQGIFISDQGAIARGRIRYINLSASAAEVAGVVVEPGRIRTVAGAGLNPPFFDGGLATSASLNQPQGVTMDSDGNLWIADTNSNKLRFVNLSTRPRTIFAGTTSSKLVPPGTIVTVNDSVPQADPTPVINAFFSIPTGLQITSEGLFIADTMRGPATVGTAARRTGLIRYINTTNQTVLMPSIGELSVVDVRPGEAITVSGGSTDSSSAVGDGARGEFVKYLAPTDIAIHPTNRNIYVADAGNNRVRVINRTTGITSSLFLPVPSGSTADTVNQITGLAFDSGGRLLVVDSGGRRIMREKNPGSGSTANGTGFDILLSGGLLNRPRDIVEGADGAYYIVNAGDPSGPLATSAHQILRMTVNETTKVGTATVYLGGTVPGYRGDGGPITAARISIQPEPVNISTIGTQVFVRTTVNIIRGLNGELIFTDSRNSAIRRIR
jgi:DNA-binding beta-propeller fold protein YncE